MAVTVLGGIYEIKVMLGIIKAGAVITFTPKGKNGNKIHILSSDIK